uniref:Potassium channel domain-containing protein n=1 Tax=Megaselia scalaris TaxID=36166 RepID=T1GUZ8_MEGSC
MIRFFLLEKYDYTGYHNSYQQHQQQQHVPQQKKQHLQQVMPRGVGVDLIEENYDIDEGILDEDDEDEECRTGTRTATKNHENVPLVIVFLILLSYISFGTVIFAFWENWSLIDGAYFCFVTLSTIGYGDFLPKQTLLQQNTPSFQLFACCAYLLLGLVLVAMSFSILENQLLWKCKRIAVRLKLAKD